jgi:DNA-directed DNA polymerase III PolC
LTGVELRPGFDGRREFGRRAGRLVLLAAGDEGYRSLCRIISRRRGASGSRGPEGMLGSDPLPLVLTFPAGLFALSDDPYVLERLLESGSFPREQLGLLLVRPAAPPGEETRLEAAQRLGVRVVADLDAVLLDPADYPLHLLQVAVRQGRRTSDAGLAAVVEGKERWLRSPGEAAALFQDVPEAVAAAAAIAESCSFDLNAGRAELPEIDLPAGENPRDRLCKMCEDAAAARRAAGKAWDEAHARRLDEELSTFEKLGLSGFLLVVVEIVERCRALDIPMAARGSAVSSLVLHLLGASPVDPIAHGLLFERFLHPGKSDWPDVDLDLPWDRRDEVIEWVYRRFGRDRVAMVAAHHVFRRKSALREGLKAWGARPALVEALSRALPPEDLEVEEVDFLGLADVAGKEESAAAAEVAAASPAGLGAALPLIQRLIGRPHHLAAHPGGIIVGAGPLEDRVPLERAPKGVVVTQYDLAAVAELGIVKIDLLGNRCLSELEETLRLSGGPAPRRLDSIPDEDRLALELADRAETVGCFQLESPAMRSLLARLPVRSQSDLVAALALIRPGPAAGEAKAEFVRRARGEKPGPPLDPSLADRLEETHGLLLYEEDIMVLLSRLGGLTLGEADELRSEIVRSGGDADTLEALRRGFLERARRHLGAGQDALTRAERGWTAAARFAAYSFNKAHAVSYGRLAYFSAYTKAHHPVEFACALLNHHQGIYPLRTLAAEFLRMGVELRGPHVNLSAYASRLEDRPARKNGPAVRVGLDKVRVLSRRAAAGILEERESRGAFGSLADFLERVRLPHRELTALVLSGACDGLPPLATDAYPFVHEAALAQLRKKVPPAEVEGLRIRKPGDSKADGARFRLYRDLVRVRNELRYLEMHLSAHPLALLRPEAGRYGCVTVREAAASPAGSELRLAVTVAALRRVPTGQGTMQFLTLEDETGLLEAAVLPPAFRALGERITTPGPFLAEGKLRRVQGAAHLEVSGLTPFHQRFQPFGHG